MELNHLHVYQLRACLEGHLEAVAGGKTYSQLSTAAQADPTNAKLTAQVATMFKGETLRGLLLYAWGWSQVGLYALYAAIALTIATIAVFGTLVFEVLMAPRRETATGRHPLPA